MLDNLEKGKNERNKTDNKTNNKIIAGAYKGKVLSLPSLDVTRSSKAVLKRVCI